MYATPQPVRPPAQTLSLNPPYIQPHYDFSGYPHHVPGVSDPASAPAWNHFYTGREDFTYSYPGSSPGAGGQVSFISQELNPSVPGGGVGGGSFTPYSFLSGQEPFSPRRRAQEPSKPTAAGGKTRTTDKYRVVYSDHQRLELEKEFQYNRYINMRRKSELSMALSLSERQCNFCSIPNRMIGNHKDFASCGEDLVPKQTCQREKAEQEEAAEFPAGVHHHSHPAGTGRKHRPPPSQQPQQQHSVR